MARDLTKLEYENYKILVMQLEDDRPMKNQKKGGEN